MTRVRNKVAFGSMKKGHVWTPGNGVFRDRMISLGLVEVVQDEIAAPIERAVVTHETQELVQKRKPGRPRKDERFKP